MAGQGAGQVLATNLRACRREQGISLSELARRSGIAKGTLSQLESGTGNPTIETVFSLSNALGVAVSVLLTQRGGPNLLVVRSEEVEVLRGQAVDLRLLRRLDAVPGMLEVYDQRVQPGAVQRSEGHPGTEHTVVVAGFLRITAENHRHEIGPGDYIGFRADGPHEYEAVGGPVFSVLLLTYPPDGGLERLGAGCLQPSDSSLAD